MKAGESRGLRREAQGSFFRTRGLRVPVSRVLEIQMSSLDKELIFFQQPCLPRIPNTGSVKRMFRIKGLYGHGLGEVVETFLHEHPFLLLVLVTNSDSPLD